MSKMDILVIPYTKNIKSSGEVDDISKYTSPLKLFDYLAVGKNPGYCSMQGPLDPTYAHCVLNRTQVTTYHGTVHAV